ncbi:hypothetical protein I7I50_00382 [Histoplasma capsulatum G186AR]|uniref:Uncharacterized protein n=1 Tax=Ajellomyces capsulatus TaxID=5037 RepID=A0A8H7YII0_AJECA|nr:hypothetical protein I7I52_07650 [Histoplasma capsulatum]QSS72516.1 hypothetical protein I7I50_00382 [Histoplasma capsulatum G186AR]
MSMSMSISPASNVGHGHPHRVQLVSCLLSPAYLHTKCIMWACKNIPPVKEPSILGR